MTAKADQQNIQVEVVLAMPDRQELVALEVAVGTTLAEAIHSPVCRNV